MHSSHHAPTTTAAAPIAPAINIRDGQSAPPGLIGQDLAQQPDMATKLSQACQAIKNTVLDPANVNKLTGRLKRRVVLD